MSEPATQSDLDPRTKKMLIWIQQHDDVVKRTKKGWIKINIGEDAIKPQFMIEETQKPAA